MKHSTRMTNVRIQIAAVLIAAGVLLPPASAGDVEPFSASATAVKLDPQIDWSRARLIVVQAGNRYKTLETFAYESVSAMYGQPELPGLTPMASLCELLFNRPAYEDTPMIYVRDKGLRMYVTEKMGDKERVRIRSKGYMTPTELMDVNVRHVIDELAPDPVKGRAVQRVHRAEETAFFLDRLVQIVPQPGPDPDAGWHTPAELRTNALLALPADQRDDDATVIQRHGPPIKGISNNAAAAVFASWITLAQAWQSGDAAGVQASLDRLADTLPTMASPGVYPKESQRAAETTYYENFVATSVFSKASIGWWLYLFGAIAAVFALVTTWRTPWVIGMVILVAALGLHAYGLGLRWYVLGRIPVANMYEAITASAWVGIALALVIELFMRTRVFLLAAHATGFVALIIASFVLPMLGSSGGEITPVMGILDDVMLRIHTVMIITSYALIFLGAVIAATYLSGYYGWRLWGAPPRGVPMPGMSFASIGAGAIPLSRVDRPVLAGDAPGDEGRSSALPNWLQEMDWCHLIVLNIAFVLLFVGIILGAVWADYSWGRPWGWDPKETFALNTWIIYAILIHARFIVRRKGLWTAWLSIAGCAMMAFNWFFVNFFIVGLHSYA